MTNELVTTMTNELSTARMVGWSEAVGAFLDTLMSSATRATYEHTLRGLAAELGSAPGDLSAADLGAWAQRQRTMVDAGAISPNTAKRRIMAVKSFFRFTDQVGATRFGRDLRAYVLRAPTGRVVKPFQVLSAAEQKRLLRAAIGQDRRILATMLHGGLRVSELCALRASDYHTDEGGRRWLLVRGKGDKARLVPVGKRLLAVLGEPAAGDGPLFVSRQGSGFYTRTRILQIVTGSLQVAGIGKRISPHSLRHTAAVGWLRAGVPVSLVQKWLGHASLATTQRYLDHLENGESHRYMP